MEKRAEPIPSDPIQSLSRIATHDRADRRNWNLSRPSRQIPETRIRDRDRIDEPAVPDEQANERAQIRHKS